MLHLLRHSIERARLREYVVGVKCTFERGERHRRMRDAGIVRTARVATVQALSVAA